MKNIENKNRISNVITELEKLTNLLKLAENDNMTLVEVSKNMGMTPQSLNRELSNTFAFYFKSRLHYLSNDEIENVLEVIETSSEKLLKRIFDIDSKTRVIFPEYDEKVLWDTVKEMLPDNYYNVVVKYYGYNVEPMTLEAIGNELGLSRSRIKDINLASIEKLKNADFINKVFGLNYLTNIELIEQNTKELRIKYDSVKAEYEKLKSYMDNDIKAINDYIEKNYPEVTKAKVKEVVDSKMSTPIEDLGFSNRTYNAFKAANYNTVEDICKAKFIDILGIKALGVKCYREIIEKIDGIKCTHPAWNELRTTIDKYLVSKGL